MDFMKVLDQTVREIKREVNLKVLKVPEIEQKVLDATSDEPWGPHGTDLQEIAQATKKFTECQMIMGVLWTRLRETDANWRHVYKALTVIEYLIANGSERAVDDILGHTYQISALSGFEYVEPNGKDSGINVRKKVETLLALLNDKEKIEAVREKAASNRDKYVGLSSQGMSYKSSSAAFGSNNYSSDHYGSFSSSRDGESFRDKYKEEDQHGYKVTRSHGTSSENAGSKTKKDNRGQKSPPFNSSKPSTQPSSSHKSSTVQPKDDDDFDDFDPRGSSTSASANASSNQVDLFGESLVGDLLGAPLPPTKSSKPGGVAVTEVDLFADADFQSASPNAPSTGSNTQENVNLFANQQPAFPPPTSPNLDFFAAPDASIPKEKGNPITKSANTGIFDPFASIPMNNFDGSDPFGAFTSHSGPLTAEPSQESTNKSHNNSLLETSTGVSDFGDFTSHSDQTSSGLRQQSTGSVSDMNPNSLAASKSVAMDTFKVKSGIWADSLSRGLIDLNISAPKKVNLADIGIVGGLDDASEEKEKAVFPSFHMGRAMGTGSGLGRSGFTSSSTATGGFSTFDNQQFGNFK